MASILFAKMRSLGLAFPILAMTATALSAQPIDPMLVSFEASPTPDENGVYSFEAEAGEIISINAYTNPQNPKPCYPEQLSGTQVKPFGSFITQTPYSQSMIVQVVESGRFQYQVFSVPDFTEYLTSDNSAQPYPEPIPVEATEPSDEYWVPDSLTLPYPESLPVEVAEPSDEYLVPDSPALPPYPESLPSLPYPEPLPVEVAEPSDEYWVPDSLTLPPYPGSLPSLPYPESMSITEPSELTDDLALPYPGSLSITEPSDEYLVPDNLALPYPESIPDEVTEPSDTSEEPWCRVTVQLASPTEQLWATANYLREQREDPEQALELYRQVIETEPGYPEPYRQYVEMLMESNFANLPPDIATDPDAIGQWLVAQPNAARQPVIEALEQLAQIYEANPTWQVDEHDQPTFLRDYATYIETGVLSETAEAILFMGF